MAILGLFNLKKGYLVIQKYLRVSGLKLGDLNAILKSIGEGANKVLKKADIDTKKTKQLYKKL